MNCRFNNINRQVLATKMCNAMSDVYVVALHTMLKLMFKRGMMLGAACHGHENDDGCLGGQQLGS